MRKCTSQALAAFAAGNAMRPAKSIWTDGNSLFSYETCIATRMPCCGAVVLNTHEYSATTSEKQRAIRRTFPVSLVEVDDVWWYNARVVDLIEAAHRL